MFCRKCGNQLAENAAVCDKCGTAVSSAAPEATKIYEPTEPQVNESPVVQAYNQPSVSKKKKSKKPIIIIIAAILVVAAVLLTIFLVVKPCSDKEAENKATALTAHGWTKDNYVMSFEALNSTQGLIRPYKFVNYITVKYWQFDGVPTWSVKGDELCISKASESSSATPDESGNVPYEDIYYDFTELSDDDIASRNVSLKENEWYVSDKYLVLGQDIFEANDDLESYKENYVNQ